MGDNLPLYLTVEQAAGYVGIGVNKMREYLSSVDPPPYLMVGNQKRIQKEKLSEYFEKRQEVRL